MNGRTVHCVDVSKMSEKELCKVLNIKYVPWYRSNMFWALAVCFSLPSIMMITDIVK